MKGLYSILFTIFLLFSNSFAETIIKIKNKCSFSTNIIVSDKSCNKYVIKPKRQKKIKINTESFKDSISFSLAYKDTIIRFNKFPIEILEFKDNKIEIGVINNYLVAKNRFDVDTTDIMDKMHFNKDYSYNALKSNLFISKMNVNKEDDAILYFLIMLDDGYRIFMTGAKLSK